MALRHSARAIPPLVLCVSANALRRTASAMISAALTAPYTGINATTPE